MRKSKKFIRIKAEGPPGATPVIREWPALDRFFKCRGFSDADAEDLAQETQKRILQSLAGESAIRDPQAYCYKIAESVAADFFRNPRKRLLQLVDQSTLQRVADEAADSLCNPPYEAEEARQEFEARWKALPKQLQHVAVLYYVHNMKYREIAAILNQSANPVRRLITQLRKYRVSDRKDD